MLSKKLTRIYKGTVSIITPTSFFSPPPSAKDDAYSLPTELWIAILQYAMVVPFLLDQYCSPADFYYFSTTHRAVSFDPAGWQWEILERQRKSFRSVCRLWRHIVDGYGEIWAYCPPPFTIKSGARRLDVDLGEVCRNKRNIPFKYSPSSLHTVEVLALCETNPVPRYLRNVGSRIKEADEEDLRQFLKNLGKIDTKVHSLICETVLRFDAVKLHQIQTTLPLLTSLTLHANAISGQFDMPCLTNLNVSSIHLDITRWNLPSLKHLAIGYLGTGPRVPPRTPPRDVIRLLPRNSYQLLSLMVFSPYKLVLNPSFWYAHPLLECLGVTQYEMQAGPSLEHPLSTICFNFASTGTDGDHFLQMAQHLVFFPWISTLITPNLDRRNIAEEEESSCVELIKICNTRNIRWYVGHGERFEYTPQRQSKWLKWPIIPTVMQTKSTLRL